MTDQSDDQTENSVSARPANVIDQLVNDALGQRFFLIGDGENDWAAHSDAVCAAHQSEYERGGY